MRSFLLFIIFISCIGIADSQVLVSSEHSTPAGRAELNTFLTDCEDDCSLKLYLEVSKLDFESTAQSGAMIRIWDEHRTKSILFGINANKEVSEPEILVLDFSIPDEPSNIILGVSELKKFEGFEFKWKENKYSIDNIRGITKVGFNGQKYSSIEKSGLSYDGILNFKPHSMEYLFLGVDVKLSLEVDTQNFNSEWKTLAHGN
jgi:hypothetical protein